VAIVTQRGQGGYSPGFRFLERFCQDVDHIVVDESVGGDDLVIVVLESAIEVGEASAGFVYDEQAGGDVVGSGAGLPVAFEASAGDVAAVHGGGAEIA